MQLKEKVAKSNEISFSMQRMGQNRVPLAIHPRPPPPPASPVVPPKRQTLCEALCDDLWAHFCTGHEQTDPKEIFSFVLIKVRKRAKMSFKMSFYGGRGVKREVSRFIENLRKDQLRSVHYTLRTTNN